MKFPIKSTKTITAVAAVVLGLAALVLNKVYNLGLTWSEIGVVLAPLTALILGKGLADFGKEQ